MLFQPDRGSYPGDSRHGLGHPRTFEAEAFWTPILERNIENSCEKLFHLQNKDGVAIFCPSIETGNNYLQFSSFLFNRIERKSLRSKEHEQEPTGLNLLVFLFFDFATLMMKKVTKFLNTQNGFDCHSLDTFICVGVSLCDFGNLNAALL
jgi:hypothetical protein